MNPISRYLCTVAAILCFALVFAAAGQGKKQPPAKPLDLNTATPEELQQLPGIGPTTAKAIVHFREKSGPFRRVEDLLVIRGITRARLEKLRPYVTVQGNPPAKSGEGERVGKSQFQRKGGRRGVRRPYRGYIQDLKLQIEQREKPIALDCERTIRGGDFSSYPNPILPDVGVTVSHWLCPNNLRCDARALAR